MTDLELFAGAGLVATCWRQLTSILQRLRSFFIVRVTLHGEAAAALQAYCWTHFQRSPFGDRLFRSFTLHVRPLNRMQAVAAETPPSQPTIFFDSWKPLGVGGWKNYENDNAVSESSIVVTIVRGLFNIDVILIAALNEFNAKKSDDKGNRYRVMRAAGMKRQRGGSSPMGYDTQAGNYPQPINSNPLQSGYKFLIWQQEELGPQNEPNPFASLAIHPSLEAVKEDFRRWKNSEAWYRAHGVPWRRGLGMLGRPGSGKTAFVRALAQEEDIPIYIFDLSSLSNEEMTDAWRTMQESAPVIPLFEDFDGTFKGRVNITPAEQSGGLTFDCFLNCLGGVETCDGVYSIVTTNHPEDIDEALGVIGKDGKPSRPGRLDTLIQMPEFSEECRRKTAHRILGDWPEVVEKIVASTEGQTPAQLTEVCVKLALTKYWEGKV